MFTVIQLLYWRSPFQVNTLSRPRWGYTTCVNPRIQQVHTILTYDLQILLRNPLLHAFLRPQHSRALSTFCNRFPLPWTPSIFARRHRTPTRSHIPSTYFLRHRWGSLRAHWPLRYHYFRNVIFLFLKRGYPVILEHYFSKLSEFLLFIPT